jgi:hypothetical protein
MVILIAGFASLALYMRMISTVQTPKNVSGKANKEGNKSKSRPGFDASDIENKSTLRLIGEIFAHKMRRNVK